ncbi:DNA polymerase III subunit chi [Pseudomaricurvus alcaniphilus]|uniref:DNA polymerase III subunit chi n=1 Tax=Pseudomaricurvus alcaniphilus TaxID=1166482 RepID=UPI00140795A9|nr:DNA polymerase III subunit chi [Pseudomaricurvus alcaniphilus]NHN39624.1 DNA polymerase III subunit chi [Pseudomaricurvus alcaniphilus]
MTSIDFYVLPHSSMEQRLDFACRWTQKALRNDHSVYVAVDNEKQADYLDRLFWQFSPDSFVPHDCEGKPQLQARVKIGFGDDCGDFHDCLVNLSQQVPGYFSRFQRLAEIVCQEEKVLANTRQHYNFYQHRGYPIETHRLPDKRADTARP